MSDMTPCNYCHIRQIMREHPGKLVLIEAQHPNPTPEYQPLLRVRIGGEILKGRAFAAVTLDCAC